MGLFDFFSNKETGPEMKDQVWMSKSAKLSGTYKLTELHPDAIVIAWFPDTEKEFAEYFETKGKAIDIKSAKNVSAFMVSHKPVIFLEHHPLKSKEDNLIRTWQAREILVLNSLDETLFSRFGGEKIINLMKQMGMAENELIEHAMVSKAIKNAQEKFDKKVRTEVQAQSVEEWFKKNLRD